jgi:hypothetical protein
MRVKFNEIFLMMASALLRRSGFDELWHFPKNSFFSSKAFILEYLFVILDID